MISPTEWPAATPMNGNASADAEQLDAASRPEATSSGWATAVSRIVSRRPRCRSGADPARRPPTTRRGDRRRSARSTRRQEAGVCALAPGRRWRARLYYFVTFPCSSRDDTTKLGRPICHFPTAVPARARSAPLASVFLPRSQTEGRVCSLGRPDRAGAPLADARRGRRNPPVVGCVAMRLGHPVAGLVARPRFQQPAEGEGEPQGVGVPGISRAVAADLVDPA